MNKILIVELNKEPYTKIVKDVEQAIIEILGEEIGYLELEEGIDIVYSNYVKKIEINRTIKDNHIIGTFVIVANKNDNWVSLNNEQITKYKEVFKLRW